MATYSEQSERGRAFNPSIVLNTKLSANARLLYVVLAALGDDSRECTRSRAELTEDSGLSESTIKRAVRELISSGIVEMHAAKNEDGGFSTNAYRLLDTPWVSQTLPLGLTDPRVDESPAQPLGSHRPKGLGLTDPRGVGSHRPKGSLLYKEGIGNLENSSTGEISKINNPKRQEHIDRPAPEEQPRMVMRNFNNINLSQPLPVQKPSRPSRPTEDPDFDKAWALYGHRIDKVLAKKAWTRAMKKTTAEAILAAIPAYVSATMGRGEPEGNGSSWKPRRKNLATWLNAEGWTEEIEPPKTGYQGRAGSDVKSQDGAIERDKVRPICKLMRSGPIGAVLDMNRAWYYHWNVQQQRDWTVEQMLETGNSAEDIDWLMDAYANGIEPTIYAQLLSDFNIPPHGSDS